MPRIRQNAARYAEVDFLQEIRRRQGHYNLMSVRALAGAAGIPHSTLNPKLHDLKKLTIEDLQKLIPTIHPEPEFLLALVGYSKQEIKKYKEEYNRGSAGEEDV